MNCNSQVGRLGAIAAGKVEVDGLDLTSPSLSLSFSLFLFLSLAFEVHYSIHDMEKERCYFGCEKSVLEGSGRVGEEDGLGTPEECNGAGGENGVGVGDWRGWRGRARMAETASGPEIAARSLYLEAPQS